ncbi:MAG: hypothetical protein Q7S93_14175 [Phenylobacterium sp.]|uniref:hypothetical protein n=1 Tax=Phenylobacterium sp. TaxID=1871053 RepID=UPI002716DFB3|nr:hypothetical protein [Phenylobacterium sp.]MDO8411196.1 hypothetical protein [Phenylobacterium sp.]
MAYYVITYDLMNQKNYAKLTAELERLAAAKVALSVWLLERFQTNQFGLRDHLLKFIDNDDKLVVIEFEKCPAWVRALPEGRKWIEARFP